MRKVLLVAALAASLALAGSAQAAAWTTVASKKGSGAFTVKAFSKTVNNPKGIRLVARSTKGMHVEWSIGCSRGSTIRAKGGSWKPGSGKRTKKLPMLDDADSCSIVAAFGSKGLAGGKWRLTLQKR